MRFFTAGTLLAAQCLMAQAASSAFVRTSGTQFTLGGKYFNFGGTNAYWLAQQSNADIDKSFKDMAALGLKVVRTWAFNEVTAVQNYGAYYTLWSGTTQKFNTGPHGFDRLDYVLAAAEKVGMKVILSLANNWDDFGGSGMYIKQLASGSKHDAFYTNSAIIKAYQKYVTFVVSRYKTNTNVFAWELINEPRCAGVLAASSSCNTKTLTTWIKNQATFIKSLDSNHLVAIGDEGFLASKTSSSDFLYNGGAGMDFSTNLALSSIDFGTFHQYPVAWGKTPAASWGNTWITDHAAVMKSLKKPVVLEEFGVPGEVATKYATYKAWYSTAQSSKLSGIMYWQFGDLLSGGNSTDDGFTIYPGETTLINLIKANAKAQTALNLAVTKRDTIDVDAPAKHARVQPNRQH
ncbi:mannan endo-1,4-beta-mannosidase, partial [Phenoliferia sp. Uapishka_3]